jgi:hypothetical protein
MDKSTQINSEFGILNFRTLVTTDRVFKTPAAPKSVVMRPVKDVDPTKKKFNIYLNAAAFTARGESTNAPGQVG